MSGDSSIFGKHSPSILNDQFFEFLGFALDFEVWIPNVWNSQKRTHTLVAMLVSDYSGLENFKFKLSQIVRPNSTIVIQQFVIQTVIIQLVF